VAPPPKPGDAMPPKENPAPKGGAEAAAAAAAPAIIHITLPADARLTIDERPTQATSGERYFISPILQPGKTYYYTFKAEQVRDSQTQSAEQRVYVRAGQESRVTLTIPSASVAAR
jgi:uncharacterized protein (TIGR03000 family)